MAFIGKNTLGMFAFFLLLLTGWAFACGATIPACKSVPEIIENYLPILIGGITILVVLACMVSRFKNGKTAAMAVNAAKILLVVGILVSIVVLAAPHVPWCKLFPPSDCIITENCDYLKISDLDTTWTDEIGCKHVCGYLIENGKKVSSVPLC